ncbi:hypothetical protein ACIGD1_11335 [Streptomyces sp. NPDC085612]|uniref:WDGH domain-containing protein n=1 Tax=Streptomyces sp. NPDC085612 TaxID=3365732 RepID=UPI0037D0E0E4
MTTDMYAQVGEWLTALGIDPRTVPIDSDLYIENGAAGRELHYEAFTLDADGRKIPDERGDLYVEHRAVPLTAEPPEHWKPFRKPTVAQVNAERDRAYRERAQLVAHLASLYPSQIAYTDPDTPEWAVVTIEAPTGQMSWHVAPADMDLFDHVERQNGLVLPWDGHTTEQKYERLQQLTGLAMSRCLPECAEMHRGGPRCRA